MSRKPDKELERLKEFLGEKVDIERIESQTEWEKRRLAREELLKGKSQKARIIGSFRHARSGFKQWASDWYRFIKKPQHKHLILLTGFLVFATYICYRMESTYWGMKNKVENTKSFKQIQIEKEKKYLQRVLKRQVDSYEQVPIKDEYDPEIRYKFEDAEIDSDMDTKEQLLEMMKKDYEAGSQIPQQYREELLQKYPNIRSRQS